MTREYIAMSSDEEGWVILYYWEGTKLCYNISGDSSEPDDNECATNDLGIELQEDIESGHMEVTQDPKEIAKYLMTKELMK